MRSLLSVSVATATVAACAVFAGPASRADVTVSVSRDVLAPGDTVTIAVKAANPTPYPLEFDGGGCLLQFEIRNEAGHVVAPVLLACPAILRHVRLAPGDSIVAEFQWAGDRWSSIRQPPGEEPGRVPAGRYRIYGVLDAVGTRPRSVPVTVVVNPAP